MVSPIPERCSGPSINVVAVFVIVFLLLLASIVAALVLMSRAV
jgi:hypothetical protein